MASPAKRAGVAVEGVAGAVAAHIAVVLELEGDAVVLLAEDVDGVAAVLDDADLLVDHLAHHDEAAVGGGEALLVALHYGGLRLPDGEVLLEHPLRQRVDGHLERGDGLLAGGLHVGAGVVDVVDEVPRVLVVDGDADLELLLAALADVDDVGEDHRVAVVPVDGGGGVFALLEAVLEDAVLERLEVDGDVVAARALEPRPAARVGDPALLEGVETPGAVVPFEVDGVDGVLLALEPVGVEHRLADDAVGVLLDEDVPAGEDGRGLGAEVGEDEPAELLNGVRLQLDARGEGAGLVLGGHFEALAVDVVEPAVVGAAQAGLLGDAEAEVDAAVGAAPVDEAVAPALVAEEGEVLAEDADGLGVGVAQLLVGGDGEPVASEELAARRAGPYPREAFVHLSAQHGSPPRARCFRLARGVYHGPPAP